MAILEPQAIPDHKRKTVTLTWDAVTDATEYLVQRTIDGNTKDLKVVPATDGEEYVDKKIPAKHIGVDGITYKVTARKPGVITAPATTAAPIELASEETEEVVLKTTIQRYTTSKLFWAAVGLLILAILATGAWYGYKFYKERKNSEKDPAAETDTSNPDKSGEPSTKSDKKRDPQLQELIDQTKGLNGKLQGAIPDSTGSESEGKHPLVNTKTVRPIIRDEMDKRFGPGGTSTDPSAKPAAGGASPGVRVGPTSGPAGKPDKTGSPDKSSTPKDPPRMARKAMKKPGLDEMEVIYDASLMPGKSWRMLYTPDGNGKPMSVDHTLVDKVYSCDLEPDELPAEAHITGLEKGGEITFRATARTRGLVKIPYGGSSIEFSLDEKRFADFQKDARYCYIAIAFKDKDKVLPPVKAYYVTYGDAPADMAPAPRPTTGPATSSVPSPSTPPPATTGSMLPSEPSVASTTSPVTPAPAPASTRSTGSGAVFIGPATEFKNAALVTKDPSGNVEIKGDTFVTNVVEAKRNNKQVIFTYRLHDMTPMTGQWPAEYFGETVSGSPQFLDQVIEFKDRGGNPVRCRRGDLYHFRNMPESERFTLFPINGSWSTVPGIIE